MKKYTSIIVLSLLACFSLNSLAQEKKDALASTLTVFSENGEKFFLVIDGERKTEKPLARVKIAGLERPYYKGKIIFDNEKLGDVSTSFQLEGVDARYNDVTYIIKKKTRKGRSYYVVNGYSFIPLSKAKTDIVENEPFEPVPTPKPVVDPTPLPVPVIIPQTPEKPMKPIVIPNPYLPNQEQKNLPPSKETKKTICASAMPAPSFALGIAAIAKEGFEDNRKSTAQQIIKANCLTIEQIKQLMGAMSFEDSRLGVAKLAYPKCTDRDSYYLVNEALQFSTSKEDLAAYIATQ